MQHRYFILNKPRGIVSQFISSHPVDLLGGLQYNFPEGTHAIGRLDAHSEGLLLLTTNPRITRLLFSSSRPHVRKYLVEVNNEISESSVQRLRDGVTIRIKGGELYVTPGCDVKPVQLPIPECDYVIPVSDHPGKTSWLTISLTEGKYHQVRKMIAAIRHRCKRLIRVSIEDIALEGLTPGGVIEMDENEFYSKLKL